MRAIRKDIQHPGQRVVSSTANVWNRKSHPFGTAEILYRANDYTYS